MGLQSIACKAADAAANSSKISLRNALLAARQAQQAQLHSEAALAARIVTVLAERKPHCVAFYWPFAGEFDTRATLVNWLHETPTHCAALPVITEKGGVLRFYRWTPETPMQEGYFKIPVPTHTSEVQPDVLLVPCVGFDLARYRLGYGGGYYDRTLARLEPRPFTVGISYECGRVMDMLPREPHDISLDLILTEKMRYE
ncbi:MAG: 5,10-methenyltetrahydrofolate synthetase [Glomeribacter sp. 1016415]|nr:5,10-methenyltetrahydrofolate synthetase [Glomeribacter sp. 1016415]